MKLERIQVAHYSDSPALAGRLKKNETVVAVDREAGKRQHAGQDDKERQPENQHQHAQPAPAEPVAGSIDVVV